VTTFGKILQEGGEDLRPLGQEIKRGENLSFEKGGILFLERRGIKRMTLPKKGPDTTTRIRGGKEVDHQKWVGKKGRLSLHGKPIICLAEKKKEKKETVWRGRKQSSKTKVSDGNHGRKGPCLGGKEKNDLKRKSISTTTQKGEVTTGE